MKNIFSIENKVIVIIGGSGHLGFTLANYFAENKGKVIAADRVGRDDFHKDASFYKIDATNKTELQSFRDEVLNKYGRVDVLINTVTAKGNDFYLPFEEVSEEGWELGLKGNLTIPFLTSQCFIPQMKSQEYGSIINISSHYGLVGNDQRIYEGSNLHELYAENHPNLERIYSHGVYNAAKGGLNNFTRYLAAYYGDFNIRVNTVSPGGLMHPNENEEFLKNYGNKVPLGRKGEFEEIIGAVAYLASDASSYVTGHNLVVDGGYTCW